MRGMEKILKAGVVLVLGMLVSGEFRLPNTTSPLHYDLFIHPHLATLTFTGHVNVLVEVHERTELFHLHSKYLNYTDIRLFPGYKSSFRIAVVKPSAPRFHVLSNMNPLSSEEGVPEEGETTVHFHTSLPTATYLVSWIVSDFPYLEGNTLGTRCRVYAPKHLLKNARYALDLTLNVTQFYSQYFHTPFPLPKLDQVGLGNFLGEAVEQWGLISYNYAYFLYDNEEGSIYDRQKISTLIANKIALQWFANLRTMEWWDDEWLNEGFGKFMEYKGDTLFLSRDMQKAMYYQDAKVSSHAIISEDKDTYEIFEAIDRVTYSKGASMFRMLEFILEPDGFRRGMNRFLNRGLYEGAVTSDLWQDLDREWESRSESGLNISSFMNTWTRQMGYPVLNVQEDGPRHIVITQRRFILSPNATFNLEQSPYGYKWDVPVNFRTPDLKKSELFWLHKEDDFLRLEKPEGAPWVKLNVDQRGYYRVNYSPSIWKGILKSIQQDHTMFSVEDRTNLLDDVFALAEADLVSYDVPLEMTKYLRKETHVVPWKAANRHLIILGSRSTNLPFYKLLQEYVADLVDPVLEQLGWDVKPEDGFLTRKLRVLAIRLGGHFENPRCLREAGEKLKQWLQDPEQTIFHSDVEMAIFKYGIYSEGSKESQEETWNALWKHYAEARSPFRKRRFINGLAYATDTGLILRFLNNMKNESLVDERDFLPQLQSLSANPAATEIVWKFVQEEWNYLTRKFSESAIRDLIPSMTWTFNTPAQLQAILIDTKLPETRSCLCALPLEYSFIAFSTKDH
ncbi:unnamed protein product [Darwinula stevensoni]|uniref:Aminopeptidase n=1 Tax=Darwinula stevensoni TaxID=69355 RepID=A0A7R8ZXG1_9CRUS|nr:unnamed protein product [Darwinula stevensoni]CAG0878546.1 unnamed protein product [Darwinula stevensoni]